MKRFVYLAVVLAGLVVGCGPKYIPGTQVPDRPEYREIVQLVEKYREAVEKRDIKTLQAMVSHKYYENAGTTSTSADDYGYGGLVNKVFRLLKNNVKAVQYRIHVQRVHIKGNRASAEFEYWAKVLISVGGQDRWIFDNDFDRLDFVKEDGVWRIVSGM